MSLYCRIIMAEDMEWTGKHGNCLDGDITEYTGLDRIIRPHKNGTGRCREKVTLHHQDGTVQTVDGHFVGSGEE